MDISVIIVNYNVKYFLEQCLYSVYNSSKSLKVEVFVVDNNSVDGSCQMVREKFPQVRLIENKSNFGFAKANNQAIRQASGKYILILNPDTVVEEKTFEKCTRFMEDHSDAGSMGVKMIDGKGKFLPESKRSLPTPAVAFYKVFGLAALFPRSKIFGRYHLGYLDKEKVHSVEVLPGAFMLIRKSVLDKVGLFDEDYFMYGEDIDLSFRITMAGYKNYYYPETTIIHYKGESTKKGSINYVMVFYRAMIIFARKHLTKNNANYISFLINIAIYVRAAASILRRFIINTINPVLNVLLIYAGYYFILPFWEKYVFQNSGTYPDEYLLLIVPSYILIWIISIYLSGGYEKHIKPGNILQGVLSGTLVILVIYALLPEHFRFSRALIIIGTVWTLFSSFLIRWFLNIINKENFKIEIIREKKRIIIVGDKSESKRVFSILEQSNIKPELVGKVYPDIKEPNGGFIGNISQIEEIVAINNADEIIFCSKNISSQEIIKTMLHFTNTDVDFKIAPPESLSIIGSNSINTAGELYVLNLNSISRSINQRRKRFLDACISLILILLSPVLVFFIKNPVTMIKNLVLVFSGKYTLIGYHGKTGKEDDSLPFLKKGILNPVDTFRHDAPEKEIIEKVNLLYAKDYRVINDFNILFKGFKNLGRKVDC
ncbi:MAG: glycosyltransferase [Bacteroidales bacterium]|nr:glycosyltransferase [Bacteroidales bacterium]